MFTLQLLFSSVLSLVLCQGVSGSGTYPWNLSLEHWAEKFCSPFFLACKSLTDLLVKCLKSSSAQDSVTSSQRDSIIYRLKSGAAERFRRHSVDGSYVDLESESSKDKRFHPYGRQYSDGEVTGSSLYCCLRESKLPETLTAVNVDIADLQEQNSWTSLSTTVQSSMFMGGEESTDQMQKRPEDPPRYSTSTHSAYSTISPLQQFPAEYSSGGIEISSCYSYQSLSPQTSRDGSVQPQYPKPIYSYSILIFMALRNSRTGSLPVSEIYSFMTEHFPYFKTAPDGWKNSIRHNLSLNKCFEKVENKKGNSSRKGCLWALNPAKVEKMQEELQKWRRKDPVTVRRSMARPGCLWEELRNDSLASDPLTLMDMSSTSEQLGPDRVGDCGKGCGSGGEEVNTAGSEAALQASVSDLYVTGLCSSDFTGTDGMSGLHSTVTNTPIALL
ncbi:hypothetical protein QTP70_000796 [Hemibagrus guttatus]|uniref:Fork-head domain-containing protein n=1 Tax=Hemibagrus guttatus TaxID=175788 RepID=A0AAE0QRV7_9TELE|nr:hypothetical protein QTP70_000796 [Hemibagrus guttatus]KAK3560485.1 hypothetical protein QTP86_009666 [Hemibagrus guttatus]